MTSQPALFDEQPKGSDSMSPSSVTPSIQSPPMLRSWRFVNVRGGDRTISGCLGGSSPCLGSNHGLPMRVSTTPTQEFTMILTLGQKNS